MGHVFAEISVFGATNSNHAVKSIGKLPRPRQKAANLFSAAMSEPQSADLPYTASIGPKPVRCNTDCPGVPKVEKVRQRWNGAKTELLNAGHLALSFLRYFVAGKVAGASTKFGGLATMLANLAHLPDLSVPRDAETDSECKKAQNAA